MYLKKRLQANETVYGVFCSTPAALSIEIIAAASYDFVVIDLEHTLIDARQLAAMLLAARSSRMAALVRVASGYQALQVLDAGAEGVVFPRVASAQAAQEAVRACYFAPLGERGLNATWHSGYGRDDLAEFTNGANEHTLVVAMIEDSEGLGNVEEIAAVEGIDVLLEGAADLSQSFGLPWQTRHPDVRAAISQIRAAARAHDRTFCAIPRVPHDCASWHCDGVHMFILGDDRGITRRAMAAHLMQHQIQVFKP
ncbi:MAG TPA: aldolase/citrate lyase family protein [Nitrosospira sp.]|nr:aldolase/citrate lyase family protein [Nitrosospira sp.]